MPWKTTTKQEQRFDLVLQMRGGATSVVALCRRFKISRVTAYKWLNRLRAGRLKALKDKSRRPRHLARRTEPLWLERMMRLRKQRPTWGARKIRCCLRARYGRRGCPAVATISRWLKRWGLAAGRRRVKAGPVVIRPGLQRARQRNDV
jgi:transposase